jgi:hypothetical protein
MRGTVAVANAENSYYRYVKFMMMREAEGRRREE